MNSSVELCVPKLRRCVLAIKRIVLIETMNVVHLRELDLNLLVLLRDLLETKSTVKTAKRSGRTQSAVSHGLGRLRAMFDDQLLIRVGGGLSLTAFAEELVDPLHRLLLDTQRLVTAPRSLDPARLQRTFTLGCTDYAEIVLVPTLMQRLRKEAPMATLVTRALGADAEAALIAREVDLVYGTRFKQLGAIVEEPLQRESMRVLLRCGHPALTRRLTRKAYAALDHVLVTPRGSPGLGRYGARSIWIGAPCRVAIAQLRLSGADCGPDRLRRDVATRICAANDRNRQTGVSASPGANRRLHLQDGLLPNAGSRPCSPLVSHTLFRRCANERPRSPKQDS